jgi:hypothetical protein
MAESFPRVPLRDPCGSRRALTTPYASTKVLEDLCLEGLKGAFLPLHNVIDSPVVRIEVEVDNIYKK